MARVGVTQILIFTRQFASMLGSRLQLTHVLDNLATETPQRRLREILVDVVEEVKRGTDLSDALARHPGAFNSIYVAIVKAGMESGQLADALYQITEYLTRTDQVVKKMRAAAFYPMLLALSFYGVLNGMFFFILPRFEAIFSGAGKELPGPTRILLSIGNVYKAHWALMLGTIVASGVAFALWVARPEGRVVWDQWKLELPLIGRLWRLASLARFIRTLSVQVRNFIPIAEAIRLSASASGNRYVEVLVHQIAADIESGAGVAQAFRSRTIFSGVVVQMVASGEEAGRLDEMLGSAASYFDSLLLQEIDTITALINPILTVVIGFAIAGMMVAAFLPVFDLSGAAV